MTEEQKLAEKELEKTLNTLSEDELNALAGGKVTEDVKKFFQTDKGKQVLKWTGIAIGGAAGVTAAAVIIGGFIKHKKKDSTKAPYTSQGMLPTKQEEYDSFFGEEPNPFGDGSSYD